MDFHCMKRKQLQALCKKHGIPANLKSHEMANRLSLLLKEDEDMESVREQSYEKDRREIVSDLDLKLVTRNAKKVKFNPEDEVFEFVPTVKRNGGREKCRRQSFVKFGSDLDVLSPPLVGGEKATHGSGDGGRLQRLLKRNGIKDEESLKHIVEIRQTEENVRKSRRLAVKNSQLEKAIVVSPLQGRRNRATKVFEGNGGGIGREGRLLSLAVKNEELLQQNVEVIGEERSLRKSRRQSVVESVPKRFLAPRGGRKKKTEVVEETEDGAGRRPPIRSIAMDGFSSKQSGEVLKEENNVRKSRRLSVLKSVLDKPSIPSSPPDGRKKETEVIEETEDGAGRRGRLQRPLISSAAKDVESLKQSGEVLEDETNARKSRRLSVLKSGLDKPSIPASQSGSRTKVTEVIEDGASRKGRRLKRNAAAKDGEDSKQSGHVLEEETNIRKPRRLSVMKSASERPTTLLAQPDNRKIVTKVTIESGNAEGRKANTRSYLGHYSGKDTESLKCVGEVLTENSVRKSMRIAHGQGMDTDSGKMEGITCDDGKNGREKKKKKSILEKYTPASEPGIDAHSGISDATVRSKEVGTPLIFDEGKFSNNETSPLLIAESVVPEPTGLQLQQVLNGNKEDAEQTNKRGEPQVSSDSIDQQTSVEVVTVTSDLQPVVSATDNIEHSVSEMLYDIPGCLEKENTDMNSIKKSEDISLRSGIGNSREEASYLDDMDDNTSNFLDSQATISQVDQYADSVLYADQLHHAGQLGMPLNPENEVKAKETLTGVDSLIEMDDLSRMKRIDIQDEVSIQNAGIAASERPELKLDPASDCSNSAGKSNEMRNHLISLELSGVNDIEEANNRPDTHSKISLPENLYDVPSNLECGNLNMKSSNEMPEDIVCGKDKSKEAMHLEDLDYDSSNLLGGLDTNSKDDPVVDGLSADKLKSSGKLKKLLSIKNTLGEGELFTSAELDVEYEVPPGGVLLTDEASTVNAGIAESELSELKLDPTSGCSSDNAENSVESQLNYIDLCNAYIDIAEAKNMTESHEEMSLPVNIPDISSNLIEEYSASETSVPDSGANVSNILSSYEKYIEFRFFHASGVDNLTHSSSNTQCDVNQNDLVANGSIHIDHSNSEEDQHDCLHFKKELATESSVEGRLSGNNRVSGSAAPVDEIHSAVYGNFGVKTSECQEAKFNNRRECCAVVTSPIKPFALLQNRKYKNSEKQESNSGDSHGSGRRDSMSYKNIVVHGHTFFNGDVTASETHNRLSSDLLTSEAMMSSRNKKDLRDIIITADAKEKVGKEMSLVDQVSPICVDTTSLIYEAVDFPFQNDPNTVKPQVEYVNDELGVHQSPSKENLLKCDNSPAKTCNVKEGTILADSPVSIGFLSEVFRESATAAMEKVKGRQTGVSSTALEKCELLEVLEMRDTSSGGLGSDCSVLLYESHEDAANKNENEEHGVNADSLEQINKLSTGCEHYEISVENSSLHRVESNLVHSCCSQCEEFSCSLVKSASFSVHAVHDTGHEAYISEEYLISNSSSETPMKRQDILLEQTHSWEEVRGDHLGALTERTVNDALNKVVLSECFHENSFRNDIILGDINRQEEARVDLDLASSEKLVLNNEGVKDVLQEVITSKGCYGSPDRSYDALAKATDIQRVQVYQNGASSEETYQTNDAFKEAISSKGSCEAFLDGTDNQIDHGDSSTDRISLHQDKIVDALKEFQVSENRFEVLSKINEAFFDETFNQEDFGPEGIASTERYLLNYEETETCDELLGATNDQRKVQAEKREMPGEEINEYSDKRHDSKLEEINNENEVKDDQGGVIFEMPLLSNKDAQDTLKEVLTSELSLHPASVEDKVETDSLGSERNVVQDCIGITNLEFSDCLLYSVESLEGSVVSSPTASRKECDTLERTLTTIAMNNPKEERVYKSMLQVRSSSLNQQIIDNEVASARGFFSESYRSSPKELDSMPIDGKDLDDEETVMMEEENNHMMNGSEDKNDSILAEFTIGEETLVEKKDNQQKVSGLGDVLGTETGEIAVASDALDRGADAATSHSNVECEALFMLPLQSNGSHVRSSDSGREEHEIPNDISMQVKSGKTHVRSSDSGREELEIPKDISMQVKSGKTHLHFRTPHKLLNLHDMKENPSNLKSPKFATSTKILSKRRPLGDLPNK